MEELVGAGLERVDTDCITFNADKAKIVAKIIEARRRGKVLDIGVFTGAFWQTYFPEMLRSAKQRVYGVDILDEFLRVSAERGINVAKCNVDTDPLPYDDNMFDIVLCESLLEHTLRPKQLLQEIHRVLAPGGTLILSVPSATTAVQRWRLLRGDSPFHPMIDNLFTKGFQKRCAVFYSPTDLKWAMSQFFIVEEMQYLDRTMHDPRSITMKVLRMISRKFPSMRDMIIVTATKPDAVGDRS